MWVATTTAQENNVQATPRNSLFDVVRRKLGFKPEEHSFRTEVDDLLGLDDNESESESESEDESLFKDSNDRGRRKYFYKYYLSLATLVSSE